MLSNLVIHYQNYHDITNFTNLTTLLYIYNSKSLYHKHQYSDDEMIQKILVRKICRHLEVAPKIICMDDLKVSRAISLHSDFRKLNWLQKFIKYFIVPRLIMKRSKTSILLKLYKFLNKLTEYSVRILKVFFIWEW